MSATRPAVGVVTPVYNGATYLAAAIESVINQSYTNWSYVIVDNCSTDETFAIAQAYAARDRRISVVRNQRHLPMLANWNEAMRRLPPGAAYCKVLHADDLLLPQCLAAMVALAEAHPEVVVVGAYRLQGERVGLTGLPTDQTVFSGRALGRRFLLEGLRIFGSPTSTLLRAEPVRRREAFYNEANLHADTEAILELLREGDFGFVHETLTVTRAHAEQNTTFARRMNSFLPGNLMTLLRHGRAFLSEREIEALLARRLQQYDRFLAQAVLQRREPAFWAYHREVCARLGYPLTRLRLARATGRFILERLCGRVGLGALFERIARPRATPARRLLRAS